MTFYKYILTIIHNGVVLQVEFDSLASMFDFIEAYMDAREVGDTIKCSYRKEEYSFFE